MSLEMKITKNNNILKPFNCNKHILVSLLPHFLHTSHLRPEDQIHRLWVHYVVDFVPCTVMLSPPGRGNQVSG